MPTNSNSDDSILKLSGQIKPAPKLKDNLLMNRPYVIFLDVDGQDGSKAIVFEPESVINFTEPTRNADGTFAKIEINAQADAPCYLKRQNEGFVKMSIHDAYHANYDLAFTFTFTNHPNY